MLDMSFRNTSLKTEKMSAAEFKGAKLRDPRAYIQPYIMQCLPRTCDPSLNVLEKKCELGSTTAIYFSSSS